MRRTVLSITTATKPKYIKVKTQRGNDIFHNRKYEK